jgi:phosphoglycerate kinase
VLAQVAPDVELLENLRFSPGEELNDPSFGADLIKGFDAYVNEAFGASHREHASIMYPPQHLPSAAGPNLIREVSTLTAIRDMPERPLVAIVGGAKVADKLGIMRVLVEKADRVLVGGGMMFTFWRAMGRSIGSSLVDDARLQECRELIDTGKVVVPVDVRCLPVGASFGSGGDDEPIVSLDVPDGYLGLDIGPKTQELFASELSLARSVLWNGPMGVFEDARLTSGTRAIADELAASDAHTIIGGGDSAAAVALYGLGDHIDFISTGGGASLELLEFGDFPSLRALREGRYQQ